MPGSTPEQFAAWLEQGRQSPATVRAYLASLRDVPTATDAAAAATTRYEKMAADVAAGRTAPATANVTVAALAAYAHFSTERGIPITGEFKPFRIERKVHAPLSSDELDRLIDAPLSAPVSPLIQARDAALLGALASTGWRVSRIAALPRSAMNDPSVPLSNFARHWCGVYLGRRRDSEPALFVRHDRARGGSPLPLTTRSIERIVALYGQAAGIAGTVTPERIRATARSAER